MKQASRPICILFTSLILLAACGKKSEGPGDDYVRLMNTGKNYLDQGQGAKALEIYQRAAKLMPADPDVHLNLANAYLLTGNAESAIAEADKVLALDSNSAAAYFVKGSANLRLMKYEEALKALQSARNLDPSEPAVSYQLGLAHLNLKHYDEAINAFTEVLAADPNHPSAHYQLSQAYLRAGQEDEAQKELKLHSQIAEKNAGKTLTAADFEKSRFTQARLPFRLEQPAKQGIAVHFTDQTQKKFGDNAGKYRGPVAVLDPNHSTNQLGLNSVFVLEPDQGFRLLWNSNGTFTASEDVYPSIPGAKYSQLLVGDLNNDRYEDIIALSDKGANIFKFAANAASMDVGPFSRLGALQAVDGALVDLDFTGKLDLLAITQQTNDLRLYRQFGPLLFTDITRTSGIPSSLKNAVSVVVDDWPKDEMMDVLVARKEGTPLLLAKQRGGPLYETNIASWPAGSVIATGDLNNDLRVDIVSVNDRKIQIVYNGTDEKKELTSENANVRRIYLQDFDNDGWLDIWTVGDKLELWRNIGQAGFENASKALGLDRISGGPFESLAFGDYDLDGDSDLIVSMVNGGLRYIQNDGGNSNHQLKVRLLGNRSNASGLGVKIEISSGGLRLVRTVQNLPVEIGVGKTTNLESFIVHWFNLAATSVDVPVDSTTQIPAFELILPEGSCPYLYAWDGKQFRFVTDILGAAPAGLPLAEDRMIESDPDEFVLIGSEKNFLPKDGYYTLQITEELREALYLDEARLTVVDHPAGTEVHPMDKLVPGKPFPPSQLITLSNEHPLLRATTLSDRDVTDLLRKEDHKRVSPEKLRQPQQRGLAEPSGVILDFASLDTAKPLVLVMNGWLRFGGGMANINASQDPSLPFPFPTLEAEVNGEWKPVNVVVGAPAGKTKTILVDLSGKLPAGTARLRVQTAFEIYWDRIALLEKSPSTETRITQLKPVQSDLHWRGFSEFENLAADWPLTPDYNRVAPNPKWRITPAGWCTRYGDVSELISARDEGLLIMNGGDELTLKFAAHQLPPRPDGCIREFFFYSDGWDKDSDFHVAAGTTVEPLPWHGMDDQLYGRQPRPKFPSDALHHKYNTRWVGEKTLSRSKLKP
jgi:tetratricopeptide (TPR) repeat protein